MKYVTFERMMSFTTCDEMIESHCIIIYRSLHYLESAQCDTSMLHVVIIRLMEDDAECDTTCRSHGASCQPTVHEDVRIRVEARERNGQQLVACENIRCRSPAYTGFDGVLCRSRYLLVNKARNSCSVPFYTDARGREEL